MRSLVFDLCRCRRPSGLRSTLRWYELPVERCNSRRWTPSTALETPLSSPAGTPTTETESSRRLTPKPKSRPMATSWRSTWQHPLASTPKHPAVFPETTRAAFEAAVAAFNEAIEDPRSAAYDAARAVFEEAVAILKPAEDAYSQAYTAAWNTASEETRAAVRDLRHEIDEVREAARTSAWAGLEDARNAVFNQAEQAARAAREAVQAAADEELAKDARGAAVEAGRASRAEGLTAAVVAEAGVNRFESGHTAPFAHFVVSAVVVESLIRSDAWAALQRSLTEACQEQNS